MMTGLTEEIRQYVIDRSEAYKRDSEDHYDFWNEHIRYVYKEAMKLAGQYHADETIVALGALLHDIALIEKAGDRKDHHLNGKILSDQILDRFSCPEDVKDRVLSVKALWLLCPGASGHSQGDGRGRPSVRGYPYEI